MRRHTGRSARTADPVPEAAGALVLRGVAKAYGTTPVLEDVDLTVPDGQLTAVLGRSGCGKTTLLRIIAGLERVDHGTVELGGVVVDDGWHRLDPARRRVGYVPQDAALFPHLTVEDNVAFALPRGSRARVTDLLELVALADARRRYPHQLSGGEQHRVALARALAVEPHVVLLDEPFAALDSGLRASVRSDVRRILRDAGSTAVLVTHDQDEAMSMADRVAVLRSGVIVQEGTPDEVYTAPADAGLATFLGEANLLDATVAGTEARTAMGTFPVRGRACPGAAVAMVRPEQVRVRRGGSGRRGRVRACEYYGHDAMLTVDLDDQTVLARVVGADAVAPGTDVTVSVLGPVITFAKTFDRSHTRR